MWVWAPVTRQKLDFCLEDEDECKCVQHFNPEEDFCTTTSQMRMKNYVWRATEDYSWLYLNVDPWPLHRYHTAAWSVALCFTLWHCTYSFSLSFEGLSSHISSNTSAEYELLALGMFQKMKGCCLPFHCHELMCCCVFVLLHDRRFSDDWIFRHLKCIWFSATESSGSCVTSDKRLRVASLESTSAEDYLSSKMLYVCRGH